MHKFKYNKYFPRNPLMEFLYEETGDDYYRIKNSINPTEEEFDIIKRGPQLSICDECTLEYEYFEQAGQTTLKGTDGVSETYPKERCLNCTRSFREQAIQYKNSPYIKQKYAGKHIDLVNKIVTKVPSMWIERELLRGNDENSKRKLRFYQDRTIDCSSTRKMYVYGRRSGKTYAMAAEILYHAFVYSQTHKGDSAYYRILFIAPSTGQITNLKDAIMDLLVNAPEYDNARTTWRGQSPYGCEFPDYNAKLSAFCASNLDGKQIRGQGADLIIIDEADYVAETILAEVVSPIMSENPYVKVIMSSTITGQHSLFYRWAMDKTSGFKMFWIRSLEAPGIDYFTDKKRRLTEVTSATYAREYDCVWTEQQDALYSMEDIDNCVKPYPYPVLKKYGDELVTIGTDFNGRDKGAHIVAVGYSPSHGMRLLNKEIVKGTNTKEGEDDRQYTQRKLMATLGMAAKYKSEYIIMDEGFSQTEIELLQNLILTPEHSSVKEIVPIAFNSNLEIKGNDGKKKLVYANKFVYDYVGIQLEHGVLVLPPEEEYSRNLEGTGLITQMREIKIDKRTDVGKAKYNKFEDHTLVAFALACLGFIYKYSPNAPHNVDHVSRVVTPQEINKIPRRIDVPEEKQVRLTVNEIQEQLAAPELEARPSRYNSRSRKLTILKRKKHGSRIYW